MLLKLGYLLQLIHGMLVLQHYHLVLQAPYLQFVMQSLKLLLIMYHQVLNFH